MVQEKPAIKANKPVTADTILLPVSVAKNIRDDRIEISESMAMSNVERSAARMRELTRMGIRISIDDFGTAIHR